MNLPEEFWRVKIQSVAESVRGTVFNYLSNTDKMLERGAGFLLTGDAGVGKTAIAALICKEVRATGNTAYFTSVWELREGTRSKLLFDGEMSLLDRCLNVDVLVLDNLCAEDAKENYNLPPRSIIELLSLRGSRKRASILTTQLDIAGLRQHFPGLLEAVQGYMVCLGVKGGNFREEKHRELLAIVAGEGEHGPR